jgi:hypothetical protein
MKTWMPPVSAAALAAALMLTNVGWSQQATPAPETDPYKINPFLSGAAGERLAPRRPPRGAAQADEPAAAISAETIAVAKAEMAKPRTEPGYKTPRLAIGQPDLQGVWSNASNTRLTRPAQFKSLVMNEEEAAKARREHPQNIRQATDDNQKTSDGLLNGKDLASGRGYNAFWIDPGNNYALVKGSWRTSWIVDPPNVQIPPQTEEGRKILNASRETSTRGNGYDNPEERSNWERCVSFSGGGPPLGNGLYNNNFRIIQSPDHVLIEAEMIHEARIVKLNGKHGPAALNLWHGDSIGWWEGDTLVVETVNISRGSGQRLTPSGKIIERFTRYNDRQVLYEFEVHDPVLYSQVWKGEMGLNASPGMYEYACHEGNYGLHGILEGGRNNDRKGITNVSGSREE